ncbi:hypothetical protein MML48_3g00013902 [Holotrichia oblita]|uniref:Uncharacterized protein n=1 Tax=Holotrichia oblita TaxID=644536 RepID=A0ACB9TBI1_HOLOL|nr:hypothetical protein MML48_3g00013902 [Holotrichia oblita]
MKRRAILTVLLLVTALALIPSSSAQCPWQRDVTELQSACLCSYSIGRELSVQCDIVQWSKLIFALQKYATDTILDLLYVNNSTIGVLRNSIFSKLKVHSVQLSGCRIRSVANDAFAGQEQYLRNLNLQDNDLTEVPVESLRRLENLQLLDLTHNRIRSIPDNAFSTLTKLTTLKLSDNNVTLYPGALNGLDGSLKNLNLRGTRQRDVPLAIRGLKTLAFLDLSQNSIKELPGVGGIKTFEDLDSLTALNLERNVIQKLEEDSFFRDQEYANVLEFDDEFNPGFPDESDANLKRITSPGYRV